MKLLLDPSSIADYETFLKVKSLPRYRIVGRVAEFPDEYANRLGIAPPEAHSGEYAPISGLFDYQRDIAALAIRRRKFALFMDCGLGKTLCMLEYARHVAEILPRDLRVLMVEPLMVIPQTLSEARRFYGDSLPIARIGRKSLGLWLEHGPERIGVTNYEALDNAPPGRLGALILDEPSLLKSHYGKWGRECLRLGAGLDYKLCLTGTPAPNDRIEYARYAVFLDAFPTVNSFLAKFFVNRGQTNERWELKPHALGTFYRALSHWCIFVTNPATYGWRDNDTSSLPPIHIHIHDVELTERQKTLSAVEAGFLFPMDMGGITGRAKFGQIAKGHYKGEDIDTLKPAFIRGLIDSWPDESTIVWCIYDKEQALIEREFPDAASLKGSTSPERRQKLIGEFQSGTRRILVSKPRILGFGLNLQIATRQVFSGLQDSFEQFYQAIKRSNRVGSTLPLNVHIPATELERPMIETVMRKAKRIQHDTEEQEVLFKNASL